MLERKIQVAAYQLGAFIDAQLVGFLMLTSPSVLSNLFVHPDYLRQGIGRRLWEGARAHIELLPDGQTVELNATPGPINFIAGSALRRFPRFPAQGSAGDAHRPAGCRHAPWARSTASLMSLNPHNGD